MDFLTLFFIFTLDVSAEQRLFRSLGSTKTAVQPRLPAKFNEPTAIRILDPRKCVVAEVQYHTINFGRH